MPVGGLELGLEDERVRDDSAVRLAWTARGGRELPAAMVGRAEQRGEAGGGIEARKAQPVDRAIAADQRAVWQSPISA